MRASVHTSFVSQHEQHHQQQQKNKINNYSNKKRNNKDGEMVSVSADGVHLHYYE
jgi:hypothetical protein